MDEGRKRVLAIVGGILSGPAPDGTPIGTIFIHGLFGGAPAPGAPAVVACSNMIVTGGTGAFLGAREQSGQTGPWTPRVASVTEDPANRRVNAFCNSFRCFLRVPHSEKLVDHSPVVGPCSARYAALPSESSAKLHRAFDCKENSRAPEMNSGRFTAGSRAIRKLSSGRSDQHRRKRASTCFGSRFRSQFVKLLTLSPSALSLNSWLDKHLLQR